MRCATMKLGGTSHICKLKPALHNLPTRAHAGLDQALSLSIYKDIVVAYANYLTPKFFHLPSYQSCICFVYTQSRVKAVVHLDKKA